MKTGRESVLERALEVMMGLTFPEKELAMDLIISLLSFEADVRAGRPAVVVREVLGQKEPQVIDRAERMRAVHVELVRMKLPKEVWAVLRGR